MTAPAFDILALLVSYLDAVLPADVRVATDVPDPRPPRLVQPRLIGWPKLPPVRRRARFDVFAWGADKGDTGGAMALGIQVIGHINALNHSTLLGVAVYAVEETMGLRQSDDTTTGVPRGWATYSIVHRDESVVY